MSFVSRQRRVSRKVSDEYKEPCGAFQPQLFRRNRCSVCFFDSSQHGSGGESKRRSKKDKDMSGAKAAAAVKEEKKRKEEEEKREEQKRQEERKREAKRDAEAAAAAERREKLREAEAMAKEAAEKEETQGRSPGPAKRPTGRVRAASMSRTRTSSVGSSSESIGVSISVEPPRQKLIKSSHKRHSSTMGDFADPTIHGKALSATISDRNIDMLSARSKELKRASSNHLPKEHRGDGLGDEKRDKKKSKKLRKRERSSSQLTRDGLERPSDLIVPNASAPSVRETAYSPRSSRLKKVKRRLSVEALPALVRSVPDTSAGKEDLATSLDSARKKKDQRSIFQRIRNKSDSSKSSKVKVQLAAAHRAAAAEEGGAAAKAKSQERLLNPIVGHLRVSVFATTIHGKLQELERDGVGVDLAVGNETLPAKLVLFSPFQPGLQPSQWIFPVSLKDLKTEELVVTVMNFVSRQTVGLLKLSLQGVPFMHESMTFGTCRSYEWKPVHRVSGSIRLALKLTKSPVRVSASGCWSQRTAGGDLDHNTWTRCPQYQLVLSKPSLVSVTLSSRVGLEHHQGFYVFKLKEGRVGVADGTEGSSVVQRLVDKDLESNIESYRMWMKASAAVDGETFLSAGTYVILVCTKDADCTGTFSLQVTAAGGVDVALEEMAEAEKEAGGFGSDGDGDSFGDCFGEEDGGSDGLPLSLPKSVGDDADGFGDGDDDDWDAEMGLGEPAAKVGVEGSDEDWDADWGDDDAVVLPKEADLDLPAASDWDMEEGDGEEAGGEEKDPMMVKLADAVEKADKAVFVTLLGQAKSVTRHMDFALLRAAEGGQVEMVKACIAHNANVDCRGSEGTTPLLVAAERGFFHIGKLLCDSGCEANVTDAAGEGVVYKASKNGHLAFLQLVWDDSMKSCKFLYEMPPVQVDTPWEVCAVYHCGGSHAAGAASQCTVPAIRPQTTLHVLEVFCSLPDGGQQVVVQLAVYNGSVVQTAICLDIGESAAADHHTPNPTLLVTALLEITGRLAGQEALPNGLSLQDAASVHVFFFTSKDFLLLDVRQEGEAGVHQYNLAGPLQDIVRVRGFWDYIDTLCLVSLDLRRQEPLLRRQRVAVTGTFPQFRMASMVLNDAGYARLSVLPKKLKDSKAEYYFIVRVGADQRKTQPRRLKELTDISENFTFSVDSAADEIQVVVFSKTKSVNSCALGGMEMKVADLEAEKISQRDWFDLESPGKKVVGSVLLEFYYSKVNTDVRL